MNQDIAQEIIILRAKHGWTQQMLAEKLGTTQRTIAAWESGVSSPLMQRMSTLLPEPDGPMTTTFCPSSTSSDTPRSASTVPKFLRMSLTDIALPTVGASRFPRERPRSSARRGLARFHDEVHRPV